MSRTLPDGMMRTRGGVRITARPALAVGGVGTVVAVVTSGLEFRLTPDESHQLRDLLHDAELRAARGDVIT